MTNHWVTVFPYCLTHVHCIQRNTQSPMEQLCRISPALMAWNHLEFLGETPGVTTHSCDSSPFAAAFLVALTWPYCSKVFFTTLSQGPQTLLPVPSPLVCITVQSDMDATFFFALCLLWHLIPRTEPLISSRHMTLYFLPLDTFTIKRVRLCRMLQKTPKL